MQRPARQNGIPGELVEASLNRYLVPALGSRSIHHVTDTDIANITNKIVAGGHPQAANTAFWYMRAFSTGVANRRNGSSRFPREELENPAPIVKRKRVVNDAELAAIRCRKPPQRLVAVSPRGIGKSGPDRQAQASGERCRTGGYMDGL
ncbi:hypothetical protein [Mesorhizobium sp.]|uniref:hypothetical protein n=1 Tax=Mesorhizobium sp. TaxID=1871066 RepID=UPI00257AADFF|nr:hypothetical protein [Mesorhizobium sp.]